ncbi:MAG: haloacid dehalogenase-like hydrolase [Clostridia bacterium]|nr:haloacid dehalogenase-like hydrolase [Clostridia bacterium]
MNVYDFDNTLYKGESMIHLFLFYLKKYPRLLKYFPGVMKVLKRYKKGEVTINDMVERYAPAIADETASVLDVENDPKEFWDKYQKNIKPFYKDLQLPDDVIITASPDYTMKEICRRLGIKNLICSEFDVEKNVLTFMCLKENKVVGFRKKYPDTEIENFYTDSPENDQPLIDISKHAYLVKGNKISKIK